MAQNYVRVRKLEHIIEEKDREIEMLKENNENVGSKSGAEEIHKVESRVKELEGIVRGLTEELLDMKAEIRNLTKAGEGREKAASTTPNRKERERVVRKGSAARKVVSETKPGSSEETNKSPESGSGDTALIIQPDGTLKAEPRKNKENVIVAGTRQTRKAPADPRRRKHPGSDTEEESKPLIYAEEDDTIEIKRKK